MKNQTTNDTEKSQYKMTTIGIIGPNTKLCSPELYDFGVMLGKKIASKDRRIVCGGLGGFMEAVCKGTKHSNIIYSGQTVGILPQDNAKYVNEYIDIVLPTGMGTARNTIIINSVDILIAAGGGAGTLSEIAFAWQKKKTVLCLTTFGGWAEQLANKNIDIRAEGLLVGVASIEDILTQLSKI